MTSSHALLAPHVQAFFTVHLCHQKRVSPQTLASCRDTFRLLLTFIQDTKGIAPSALCVSDLDAPLILAFLDHLEDHRVVFQKWRWTEINVTLGLIFIASLRKEWPMTFIAVRCPHCQSDQIVKRGKTARGTQRYLCQNTLCAKGSFLLDYCNRGCLPEVKHMIIDMSLNPSMWPLLSSPLEHFLPLLSHILPIVLNELILIAAASEVAVHLA